MSANKFLSKFFPEDMFYRFNDKIIEISEEQVKSQYTLPEDANFYIHPQKETKIAPASVLTEIAIQGGPVVLSKYYIVQKGNDIFSHDVYLLSSKTDFKLYPTAGEKLFINSHLINFKEELMTMRCHVEISKSAGEIVLTGEFTTKMIESQDNG